MTNVTASDLPSSALLTFNFIFQILLWILILLGNALTIAVIIKYKHMRTTTNALIFSMSCSDLYVGIYGFLRSMLFLYGVVKQTYNGAWYLVLVDALLSLGYSCSVSHIFAVAIERYIGVVYPFKYHILFSKKRIVLIIAILWSVSAITQIAPIFIYIVYPQIRYYYESVLLIAIYFIVGVIIMVMYAQILREVYKQTRQIKTISQNQNREEIQKKQDFKATTTIGLVVLAYFVSWTPSIIFMCLMTSNAVEYTLRVSTIQRTCVLIGVANSAINVFIYAAKNRTFRKAYQSFLLCRNLEHVEE